MKHPYTIKYGPKYDPCQMKMRLLLFRVILVICAIFVVFLIFEIYLRIFYPQTTLSKAEVFSFKCFEEGKYRWIKLASDKTCTLKHIGGAFPDTIVKTNSLGLRNQEIRMPKPSGMKRILFVGDSFTMGWGVSENEVFPRVAEGELIKQNMSFPVETINAGFTASGPSGYYLYLKNWGMDLDPDVVVVGFFIGNDITARRDVEWVSTDSEGLPEVIRSTTVFVGVNGELRNRKLPLKYSYPFLRESHLFIFLFTRLFPDVRVPSPMAKFLHDAIRNGNSEIQIKRPLTPLNCLFEKNCTTMDKEKNEVKKLFLGMKKMVETKNKKLLVVLIPTEFQVQPEASVKYNIIPQFDKDEIRIPNDEFISFFSQNGIEYLDLLPVFQNHVSEKTYFEADDHWNPMGHRIAAKAISEKLKEIIAN